MTTPSADKIAAAAAKAKAKADAAAKQVADDQAWLDAKTADMSDAQKDEVFRAASRNCAGTTNNNGKIVLACPLPRKMVNCVSADPFDCPNGHIDDDASKGCKLSDGAAKSLIDEKTGTKIDGQFTSEAEGGSFLSPYVPWGPFAHVDCNKGMPPPKVETYAQNHSGVTIGTGVDLGQIDDDHADAYIASLKKRGVSQDTLDKIRPLLGKKREQACAALRTAKGSGSLVFPQSDVEKIDEQAMSERLRPMRNAYNSAAKDYRDDLSGAIAKATKAGDLTKVTALKAQLDNVPNWADLSATKQTIMFDSFYQEYKLDGSAEDFVSAVLDNDDDAATAALSAKARGTSAIATRGAKELDYFTGQ